MSVDDIDKRSIPRVEVNWPITVFTEQGAIQGETLNITGEGIGIRSDEPLRLNEIYRIFIIPGDEMAIEVRGRVVWSDVYAIDDQDSAVAIGVCFVEINEEDRVVIIDLAANVD
jgi:hypothetical protein